MRSTRTIVFGCALIAVALIFWVILSKIRHSSAPTVAAVPTALPDGATNVSAPSAGRIAQAAVDIPAGSIVTASMLEMKDYNGPSTKGFITDVDGQAAGFITRVTLTKGSLIRPEDDFIGHISQVGIAGVLRPGTRALVLPLPGKPTLHDLVKIGNSVDIIAAFDGQESRTIVENVRVLAVDVFANDYPPVKAAMRGAYKAEPQGTRIAAANIAPGAPSAANAGAAPDSVPPAQNPTPTPVPPNLPPLDPALTIEVTPQQAAAIQLAQASGAPLDFLLRPALPGNRSLEATLVSDNGTLGGALGGAGTGQPIVNSVTKRQLAPYAEAVKNRGAANNSKTGGGSTGKLPGGASRAGDGARDSSSSLGSGRSGRSARAAFPVPDFPPITTTTSPSEITPTPFNPASISGGGNGNNGGNSEFGGAGGKGERLAPRAPSTYQIPIYSDGGVVRTETVPVPIR